MPTSLILPHAPKDSQRNRLKESLTPAWSSKDVQSKEEKAPKLEESQTSQKFSF